jgi:hypothetical protein
MGPVEVYEDSEHEEDIEDPFTPDDFKEWKSDLKVARKAYESVLSGERLPVPEPSSNGMEKRIVSASTDRSRYHPLTISQTRRKLGETPPASRPRRELFSHNTLVFIGSRSSEENLILTNIADIEKLRAIAEWTRSSEDNLLPSKERLIGLLEASKYEDMTQVRSAAPSPASQQATSQPPSTKSTRHSEKRNSPRILSNQPDAASRYTSAGTFAISRSEMKQPAKDYEPDSDMSDDEAKDDMSENSSEVDAHEAHPTTPTQTPSQRASEPRAWSSVLTTVKNVVSSPFKFFGRTPTAGSAVTTNSNETEFTFAHPHKLPHLLTTPTRTSKQRAKPQSERRDISTKQRRVSSSSRVPQTERHRRHVDKTPLHLRGAPSASDMQKLHNEQASMRQRQREAETASLEQDEPSHGKTFRAPSPLSDDSDGDGEDVNDDNDEMNGDETASLALRKDWPFLRKNKPALQAPENKPALAAAPANWDKTDALFEKACLKSKSRVHFEDERSEKEHLQEREERIKELFIGPFEKNRLCKLNEHMNRKNRVVKMDADDDENPYYFARDPERNLPMYRMIRANEPDWICENDFGEEAWWFHLPPDSENEWESFWKLEHGQEPFTRGRASRRRIDFEAYMNKPENREKEKKLLLSKWNAMSESKRQALLPKLPQHLMNIMEFDDGLPHQRNKITKGGKDAFMDEYAIYQPLGFTSAATSSGTSNESSTAIPTTSGTFKAPSDSGSDNEEDGDVERPEDIQTVPAPGPATPTPPPKPRPGNAQLPQPLPANAALGSANKYRPFTPSNLRNVTQMSPLQQDQENRQESSDKESGKENHQKEKVNDATETMTKEKAAAKLKDVYDLIRDLNAQGKIPPVVLPKARVMDFELPPEYPGKYSDYRDEINGAIKAAFNKENKENERD